MRSRRRQPSIARRLATASSHAPGLSGMPASGHRAEGFEQRLLRQILGPREVARVPGQCRRRCAPTRRATPPPPPGGHVSRRHSWCQRRAADSPPSTVSSYAGMVPKNDSTPRRRASLELLRAEASDELAVVIAERLRAGEDPWDFMEDLPYRRRTRRLHAACRDHRRERRIAAERRAALPGAPPDRPRIPPADARRLAAARRREHAPPLGCDGACRGLIVSCWQPAIPALSPATRCRRADRCR